MFVLGAKRPLVPLAGLAVVLAVLALLLLSPRASAQTPTIFKVNANGPVALVEWYSGGFSGFVYTVKEGELRTYLHYSICNSQGTCVLGQGEIPKTALTGGPGRITLNVDTSVLPDFYHDGGPGGMVSVTWQDGGQFLTRMAGTTEIRSPGYVLRTNGSSEYAMGTAEGTVVGFLIEGIGGPYYASLGVVHNSSITIEKIN